MKQAIKLVISLTYKWCTLLTDVIDLLVYNANGVLNLSTRHIIFLIGHIDILDVDSEMGYTLIKTHETFNHDTEWTKKILAGGMHVYNFVNNSIELP